MSASRIDAFLLLTADCREIAIGAELSVAENIQVIHPFLDGMY